MSEPDAFRWIQKTSMDKRLTMREVAAAVVNSSASASGSATIRTGTPAAPGSGAGAQGSAGESAPGGAELLTADGFRGPSLTT